MRCLVVRCGEETLRLALPRGEARLGSDPSADLRVPFAGVSRLHGRLIPGPAGPTLVDLDSKNGLWVNGRRVREALLLPGVLAHLGSASVSVDESPTSDLELGLRVEWQPSSLPLGLMKADTATGEFSGPGGDAAGTLRLIREVGVTGRKDLRRNLRDILASARRVLGAETVAVLVSRRGADPQCIAIDGPALPRIPALVRFAKEPSREPDGEPAATSWSGRLLIAARSDSHGREHLVAVLPPGVVRLHWQQELLDFLSERILSEGSRGLPDVLRRTFRSNTGTASRLVFPPDMVPGESPAIQGLYASISKTVRSPLDVLLLGETGTGKELFARLIHLSGPTGGGPFVAINCAAIPAELLEAELFGVQGRVATGVDPRTGRFLEAEGGTLFLDEIGELACPLQAKLLRFLQEREVHPLGASHPRKLNVKVVSASNRDLQADSRAGTFRADLYYRLRGLQFHIPPLRDRLEDIPPLVAAFAARSAREHGLTISGFSKRAIELLCAHRWPGNIRELDSEIRRAVLLCPNGFVQSSHLAPVSWAVEAEARTAASVFPAQSGVGDPAPQPRRVLGDPARLGDAPPDTWTDLRTRIESVERAAIDEALRRTGGNKSHAARLLGLTRAGLAMKLKRLLGGFNS